MRIPNPRPTTAVVGFKAYSVAEFCQLYRLGLTSLYALWKLGKGPPRMRVGRRVLIPAAGAAEWFAAQQIKDEQAAEG